MPVLPSDPVRVAPRLRRTLTFLLPDGWRGEVVDLSLTGLRVRCLALIEQDAELEGKLILPSGKELRLKARVVWVTPPDHSIRVLGEIGLSLVDPPAEYHRALAELFASDE